MRFGNLHFLWLVWIIPLVVLFFMWAFKRKTQLIEKFVSPELKGRLLGGVSQRRQYIKALLVILGIAFTIIALIRPKYGFHWEEVKSRGVDIMIALDVSKSMLAEDVSPNRIERAKREIIDLLDMLQGDRVGLIAFAGTSFLQCPLTLDYGALQIFIDQLDTDFIPVPGTNITETIRRSIDTFDKKTKKSRVLILITDGEDHHGSTEEAALEAMKEGIKIYAIGIGKEGGAPIPDAQDGGFRKNKKGELVLTYLNEGALQKIALTTGGSYVRSVTGNLDLEKIYLDIRQNVEDKELKSGKRQRFEERFQWPLALALIILVFELFFSERQARSTSLNSRIRNGFLLLCKKKNVMALIGTLGLTLVPPKSSAEIIPGKTSKALNAYENGQYSDALESLLNLHIEDPENLVLQYNIANTYYKMGDLENAKKLYQGLAVRGDEDLSQKVFYNLGNTAYAEGKLDEALNYYQKALDIDPHDADAKHNLNFIREEIKRRLEEQKKRQEEEQNKNEQQSGDQKRNDDNQEGSQQEENQDADQEQGKPQEEPREEDAANDEEKSAPNEAQDDANRGQNEEDTANHEPGQKMSQEEAERWLSTLNEDKNRFSKERTKGQRQYQIEKDW